MAGTFDEVKKIIVEQLGVDPAKVPMVHLGTGEMWVEDFMY